VLTTPRRTPLEDDLTRVLASKVGSERDCRLVGLVLGWDGGRGCCLKEAGEELGITRERARQIFDQAIEQVRTAKVSSALDETLALVTRMSNRAAEDIEAELVARRFTRHRFAMQGLLKTAQVFGRAPKFTLEASGGKLFVTAGAGVVQSILQTALRSNSRRGIQNVSALCSAIPKRYRRRSDRLLIRQVLNTRRDIRWLDAEETFWLASVPRNPMVRCLKKVMSYASPVALSDLYRAIGRLPAKQRATISRRLLLRFCEQSPFCRVANGQVERVMQLTAASFISDAERIVCQIIRKNGDKLSIERLQSLCAEAGVPKPNLWRIVLYSPLIFRPAPRVYSTITAKS
jgi:hypothetical protein